MVTPSGCSFSVQTFVDSGSAGNFIHSSLVGKTHLLVICLQKPLTISLISVNVLPGTIQYCTVPLCFQKGALHREKISFRNLQKSTCSLLIGLPWLQCPWWLIGYLGKSCAGASNAALFAMSYIIENMDKSFIHNPYSQADADFFFVENKYGYLWLCLDYRGLKKITVQNK